MAKSPGPLSERSHRLSGWPSGLCSPFPSKLQAWTVSLPIHCAISPVRQVLKKNHLNTNFSSPFPEALQAAPCSPSPSGQTTPSPEVVRCLQRRAKTSAGSPSAPEAPTRDRPPKAAAPGAKTKRLLLAPRAGRRRPGGRGGTQRQREAAARL